MANVNRDYKKDNRKNIAIVTLAVLLVLTVFTAVLGLTGMNVTSDGLYKLLPWIPSLSDRWQQAMAPGVELGGGTYYLYTAEKPEDLSDADFSKKLDDTVKVIKERLSLIGSSAKVVREGDSAIRVSVAAADAGTEIEALISAKAQFTFADPDGNVFLTSEHIKSAAFGKTNATDETFSLAFSFNEEGAKLFGDVSAASVGKAITIAIDGQTVASPSISEAMTGGSASVPGFELETVRRYAIQMNSGALALGITRSESGDSAATLGEGVLDGIILAAAIVLLGVSLYFVLRFKVGGLMAAWAIVAQVIVFFFLIAATAINAGTRLSLVNAFVILVMLALTVYSLVTLYAKMRLLVNRGRAPRSALSEAFGKGSRTVQIVHGALLFIALTLMTIFKTAEYGLTGRIIALGVISNFAIVFIFLRALMQNTANLLGDKQDMLCPARKQ